MLGLTFKENVPDIRNTKVVDILAELKEYGVETLVHDPVVHPGEAREEYGIELVGLEEAGTVDGVIWAVAHEQFNGVSVEKLKGLCSNGNGQGIVVDVKSMLNRSEVEAAGLLYWSL